MQARENLQPGAPILDTQPTRSQMFRSLAYRGFKLFFFGRIVSLVGFWLQDTALSWLVYRLSGSALDLGITGFLDKIPVLFLVPLAGVFLDRWDTRKVNIISQSLATLQATVLAALTLSGHIQVWHVFVLSLCNGVIGAFDIPARQSLFVLLVEKPDLANAIALNYSVVQGARIIGPALAGLMVKHVGEGWCFLLNALSFLAVVAALVLIKPIHVQTYRPPANFWMDFREGLRYAWRKRVVRSVILLVGGFSLAGMSYVDILPVYAKEVLKGDSSTFGGLMTMAGFGALGGAMLLAARESAKGLERVIAVLGLVAGGCLIGLSRCDHFWTAAPFMMLLGLGFTAINAGSNTVLQLSVNDEVRGRVLGLYMMAFQGLMPFGSLFAGWVAKSYGVTSMLPLGGSACVLVALWFGWEGWRKRG